MHRDGTVRGEAVMTHVRSVPASVRVPVLREACPPRQRQEMGRIKRHEPKPDV